LITGGHIRRDEDKFFLGLFTLFDFKSGIAQRIELSQFEGFDTSKRGGKFGDVLYKPIQITILCLGID
jgi:hypothetical protein